MSISPKIDFDNDYRFKVMRQSFKEPFEIRTKADVLSWRSVWTQSLTSWHSPYKCLLDCSNLTIHDTTEVRDELALMFRFLEGFFLRQAVGFGFSEQMGHHSLPIPVKATTEEASKELGIRTARQKADPQDFRGNINLQNHFQQHVVELSFQTEVKVETLEQMRTLKSKLMNNLMQWHSKWNLLIDCSLVTFDEAIFSEFEKLITLFRGLHLKQCIGYGPLAGKKEDYPFQVYRARHNAAARLENEGDTAGSDANCNSRKLKAQTP